MRPVYEAVEVSAEAVDAVDAVEDDGGGLNDPQGPPDGRGRRVLVAFPRAEDCGSKCMHIIPQESRVSF